MRKSKHKAAAWSGDEECQDIVYLGNSFMFATLVKFKTGNPHNLNSKSNGIHREGILPTPPRNMKLPDTVREKPSGPAPQILSIS